MNQPDVSQARVRAVNHIYQSPFEILQLNPNSIQSGDVLRAKRRMLTQLELEKEQSVKAEQQELILNAAAELEVPDRLKLHKLIAENPALHSFLKTSKWQDLHQIPTQLRHEKQLMEFLEPYFAPFFDNELMVYWNGLDYNRMALLDEEPFYPKRTYRFYKRFYALLMDTNERMEWLLGGGMPINEFYHTAQRLLSLKFIRLVAALPGPFDPIRNMLFEKMQRILSMYISNNGRMYHAIDALNELEKVGEDISLDLLQIRSEYEERLETERKLASERLGVIGLIPVFAFAISVAMHFNILPSEAIYLFPSVALVVGVYAFFDFLQDMINKHSKKDWFWIPALFVGSILTMQFYWLYHYQTQTRLGNILKGLYIAGISISLICLLALVIK